jgi:hypothetical protein
MRDPQRSSGLVLVTGCPRSGTKYISCLLAELGLDVQHEAMGRDGSSSWCMAVDADETPWGPPRREHTFTTAFHQIRNPVAVIPSFSTLQEPSWRFVYAHTPCRPEDPPLVRAAKLWYHWNRHTERVTEWRYRVEQLPAVFDEFCRRIGVPADRQALKRVPANVNTRAFGGIGRVCKWVCSKLAIEPPAFVRNRCIDRSVYARSGAAAFSWDALRLLDRAVHDQVLGLAMEYGYTAQELGFPPKPAPAGNGGNRPRLPSSAAAAIAWTASASASVSAISATCGAAV